MLRRTSLLLRAALLIMTLTYAIAPLASRAQQATPVAAMSVAAEGLANPRGLTWTLDGTMYVAVSGSGGEQPGPEGSPFSGGATASVAQVRNGQVTTLAEGLPSSVWRDIDWVWGVMDVALLGGHLYALDGGGGAIHGNPATPSGVYRVHMDGTTEVVVDLGAWVDDNPVAHPPPEGVPNNGSFFAMIPVGNALWVSESVNGQILEVTPSGEVTRIADLSEGHRVPTGLAPAPDGGAYVGFLTAIPYVAGSASVAHVDPDGTVETVWAGLTAVTGVAVGPDGTLYAAELAAVTTDSEPFLTPDTGRILRQTGPESSEITAAGLPLPVNIRFGPDDALYVSAPAVGADDGSGQILRILPGDTAAP